MRASATSIWLSLLTVSLAAIAPGHAQADGVGPQSPKLTSGFGYVDRSGLNEHVTRGVIEGVVTGAFIGYAVSSDTDERTTSRVLTGAILGAAAGVVLPLALNRDNKEVRTGDVIFLNVAQNWGLAHGFVVPLLFQLSGGGSGLDGVTSSELRVDLGLSAALSLTAGALASMGSVEADLNFTPGQASSIGSAGLWGGLAGLLLTRIAGPAEASVGWTQAALGSMLALGDAAMLTTWLNRDRFDIDRGRVLLINIGGAAGAMVGLAAAYFLDPGLDNHRVVAGSLLVGAGLGLGTGYYLSYGSDEFKKSAPPMAGNGLSLVQYHNGHWGGGVPMPTLTVVPNRSGGRGVQPALSLADGRF